MPLAPTDVVDQTPGSLPPTPAPEPSAPVHGGKAEIMRHKLASQPKVAIIIPLSPGEKEGSTESVILNGYRINVRKGIYVQVPQQVAQVIMESQQMTQEAINNYFLMDGSGVSNAMRRKDTTNE